MDLSRLGTALVTRWGAATDAGPVRRRNEDSWLAEPPLYAVADGMGGHADGAAASAAALHRLAAGMRPGAVAGARADLVDLDRAIASAAADVAALADPASPLTADMDSLRRSSKKASSEKSSSNSSCDGGMTLKNGDG